MSNKRKVSTDALETLGSIIDESQKRDAIHLAVEPVVAGSILHPGGHIKVIDGVAYKTAVGEGTGIVDPFLHKPVRKGERFWFVMYPRMVHSLRHVWSHPDFPDEVVAPAPNKTESEKWLRDFCEKHDCPDYDTVLELVEKGSLPSPDEEYYPNGGEYTAEYLLFCGSDAHGEIPREFWEHMEIVLGRKLEFHPTYFSCTC